MLYEPADGSLFSLHSLRVVDGISSIQKSQQKTREVVLIASFDGIGKIRRVKKGATSNSIRRAALSMAAETTWPVIAAEIIDNKKGIVRAIGVVETEKSNPLSVEAFDEWARRLAADLQRDADTATEEVVAGALGIIGGLDWGAASTAEWIAMEEELAMLLASPSTAMLEGQIVSLVTRSSSVVDAVGTAMARTPAISGTPGVALNLPGREIGQSFNRFHSWWVRDNYGRIAPSLAARARPIITAGIRDGLGRKAIAEQLGATITNGYRASNYWNTVAANAVGHARSYTQGASLRAAGIERFRYVAILDDRTTDTCLYCHGKIMNNGAAMGRMDRMLTATSPEQIMDISPMARQSTDGRVYYRYSDGSEQTLFNVLESGVGTGGVPGNYSNILPLGEMAELGLGMPPLHHACRTTLVSA